MAVRDIVVVGGSAGSLKPILQVFDSLPDELPAAVFVVTHMQPRERSILADVLNGRTRTRAAPASEGAVIENGRVYVPCRTGT